MRELKQSTAVNVIIFMADSTDHITGKTGLTLTVTLSKDGGAFASISPAVTERTSGWYNIALTSSHTDTLGDCVVRATSTGADASERVFNVVANVEADSYGIVNNGTYGNAQLVRTSALPANFSAMSITVGGLVDITQAAADKVWGTAARTLTSFETLVADVWGYASRLLTAGTNIALAKGTGVTGFNDLSLANIEATTILAKEATLAHATYGLSALNTDLDAIKGDTANILADTSTDGVAIAAVDKNAGENGQAQGGGALTITLRAAASATSELFTGQKISIYAGTGAGQTRGVASYAGATKIATVARAWTVAPDATSMYRIEYDFGPKVDNALAVTTGTNNDKTEYALSAAGVDAILDEVVEGGLTMRQILRIGLAALAGKSSGGGTATLLFKGADGTTTRITATVDADGNRTAITVSGA